METDRHLGPGVSSMYCVYLTRFFTNEISH